MKIGIQERKGTDPGPNAGGREPGIRYYSTTIGTMIRGRIIVRHDVIPPDPVVVVVRYRRRVVVGDVLVPVQATFGGEDLLEERRDYHTNTLFYSNSSGARLVGTYHPLNLELGWMDEAAVCRAVCVGACRSDADKEMIILLKQKLEGKKGHNFPSFLENREKRERFKKKECVSYVVLLTIKDRRNK